MSGTTKKRVHMPDIIKEINAELNHVKDARLQVFVEVFLRPKITEAIKERKNRLQFPLAELEKMFHEVGLNEAKMSFNAAFTTKKEHFEYWYSLYKSDPIAVKKFAKACYECSKIGSLSRIKRLKSDEPRPAHLIEKIRNLDRHGLPKKTEARPLLKEELRKITNYWWKQYSAVDLSIDLPFRWLTLLKKSGLSSSIHVEGYFYESFNMERGMYAEHQTFYEMIITDYALWQTRLIIIKNTLENLHFSIYWE